MRRIEPRVFRPAKGKGKAWVICPAPGTQRLLRDAIGQGRYDAKTQRFVIPWSRALDAAKALMNEHGIVHYSQATTRQTTCTEECWTADPNTWDKCECGCAGFNHGSGMPMGSEVKEGLSVHHERHVLERTFKKGAPWPFG